MPKEDPAKGQESIVTATWGDAILDHGFASIPNLLLEQQAQLQLSAREFQLIVTVLGMKRKSGVQITPLSTVAGRIGCSAETIQTTVERLEDKGFLTRDRVGDAWKSNWTWNFSGLLRQLLVNNKAQSILTDTAQSILTDTAQSILTDTINKSLDLESNLQITSNTNPSVQELNALVTLSALDLQTVQDGKADDEGKTITKRKSRTPKPLESLTEYEMTSRVDLAVAFRNHARTLADVKALQDATWNATTQNKWVADIGKVIKFFGVTSDEIFAVMREVRKDYDRNPTDGFHWWTNVRCPIKLMEKVRNSEETVFERLRNEFVIRPKARQEDAQQQRRAVVAGARSGSGGFTKFGG